MKVFKFGGASINSTERIENVSKIIRSYQGEKLLIIISAMGKVTNALERVAEEFYKGQKEQALALFHELKMEHNTVAKQLTGHTIDQFTDIFTEVEWLLHDKPVRDYDYYYDQIVCCGELLSTIAVSHYFNHIGIKNKWMDVRDIVRTDDNFRDANIDWNFTQAKINKEVLPAFSDTDIIITQGFIGSTDENESTTLGREGSDYSAAIFANMLNAGSQTIWKDVEGVMNADPKKFNDAVYIDSLSYTEVIEMAYYGAQVIHPKTIKPLQNKGIPLHVKCFLNAALKGTVISSQPVHNLPPIIVVKQNQALLQLSSKDFSFIGETGVGNLYALMAGFKISPNLVQSGAITVMCCLDDKSDKVEKLALAAGDLFDVQVERNLTLLTVRHYNDAIVEKLTAAKQQVLSQKTPDTIQILLKE
ncbi:MAG TPA: aspartate kinase [Ferruginibacter sp.]|nr:aspartate kinase [Ferruginibacter sp.]